MNEDLEVPACTVHGEVPVCEASREDQEPGTNGVDEAEEPSAPEEVKEMKGGKGKLQDVEYDDEK